MADQWNAEARQRGQATTNADQRALAEGCFYDPSAAADSLRFIDKHMTLEDGRPFPLLEWEIDLSCRLFGWLRPDGSMRFRHCHLEIARGAGKSAFGSAVATYRMFGFRTPRQIASVSGTRSQARLIFGGAKKAIARAPMLAAASKIYRSEIVASTGTTYGVVASEAGLTQGLRASEIFFDELHVHKTRDTWDSMLFSARKTRDHLVFCTTTPGDDLASIAYERHQACADILSGTSDDIELLPVLYNVPMEADYRDESQWLKGNPSLGAIVSWADQRKACLEAASSPAAQTNFRRYALSQWVKGSSQWIEATAWDALRRDSSLESRAGQSCFAGLDLGGARDLTSVGLVFDDGFVDSVVFLPEGAIDARSQADGAPYEAWAKRGLVIPIPGEAMDEEVVAEAIVAFLRRFKVRATGFDRWRAGLITRKLAREGFRPVEINQGTASQTGPTRSFEGAVHNRRISHSGNPLLAWAVSNAVLHTDRAGNCKPQKRHKDSPKRIDPLAAVLFAWNLACAKGNGADARAAVFG